MKKLMLFCCFAIVAAIASGQSVSQDRLINAGISMMSFHHPDACLRQCEPLTGKENQPIGYILHFSPSGFLILSATESIDPVYAYSREGNVDPEETEARTLRDIVLSDLTQRISVSQFYTTSQQLKVEKRWKEFLSGSYRNPLFQQWPPEGTTLTEGWVETNWTQNDPYNGMCPVDLNSQTRSLAGCPAVAMAMVLHYHKEINGTRFDPGDDYYHSFGAGNIYTIDDDFLQRGFPCFDTLNLWMDTLEQCFSSGTALTSLTEAALCFACGVTAHQVYSATSSGTFGLGQAIMAYQRFGFTASELVLYADDSTLATRISDNIKVMLPVHLGLKVSGGSGGHNLVVDGYNTDDFFHFNFGWGGYANGWYMLPPEPGIPYNLTIFDGAVINIKSDLYTGTRAIPSTTSERLVYPNPAWEEVTVSGIQGPAEWTLYDLTCRKIRTIKLFGNKASVKITDLQPGGYFYQISGSNGIVRQGKLIIR